MNDIIKLDTVDKYNQLFGLETLHPSVSVIDLSEATRFPPVVFFRAVANSIRSCPGCF